MARRPTLRLTIPDKLFLAAYNSRNDFHHLLGNETKLWHTLWIHLFFVTKTYGTEVKDIASLLFAMCRTSR